MAEGDEMILGFCTLPTVEDNTSVMGDRTETQSPPTYEGEVITAGADDFPRLKDQHRNDGGGTSVKNIVDQRGIVFSVNDTESPTPPKLLKSDSSANSAINSTATTVISKPKKKKKSKSPGTPPLSCTKCGVKFTKKEDLDSHDSNKCKPSRPLNSKECAVCGKKFKYNSHLKQHMLCMHTKVTIFICPICGTKISGWRRSIERHMVSHAGKIQCPTCVFKGQSIDEVDKHILLAGVDHLECRCCPIRFGSREEFFQHVNVHIPKMDSSDPLVCIKCNEQFTQTLEFNNHVRYVCKYSWDCDATASTANNDQPVQFIIPEQVACDEGQKEISLSHSDMKDSVITINSTEGAQHAVLNASPELFQAVRVVEGTDGSSSTTVILIPQILLMSGGVPASLGDQDQIVLLDCGGAAVPGSVPGEFTILPSDKLSLNQASVPQESQAQTHPTSHCEDERMVVDTKPPSGAPALSVQNVFSLPQTQTQTQPQPQPEAQGHPQIEQLQDDLPALMCSVCNEILKDSVSFEQHALQHSNRPSVITGKTSHKCVDCGQSFAVKDHLDQHAVTFHSDKAFVKCPVCHIQISEEHINLNVHLSKAHKARVEASGKLTYFSETA